MAIWLPIVLGHVLGWALAIRPALHRIMLKEVCSRCDKTRKDHGNYRHRGLAEFKPRGAFRDRDGGDVAEAIWRAFWWPFRLVVLSVRFVAAATGSGIMSAVLRTTPLTGPELERRIREQEALIAQLSKELDDPKPAAEPTTEPAIVPPPPAPPVVVDCSSWEPRRFPPPPPPPPRPDVTVWR